MTGGSPGESGRGGDPSKVIVVLGLGPGMPCGASGSAVEADGGCGPRRPVQEAAYLTGFQLCLWKQCE